MHPFAELTNRTPSPSQKEDPNFNRKHSPWTAARHKKKTRSVQHQQQCSGDAVPVYQQVIPEAYNSPGKAWMLLCTECFLVFTSFASRAYACTRSEQALLTPSCPNSTSCVLVLCCCHLCLAAATVKTAGVTAEYSLADGVSSGSQEATASPLSSPPVSKGSAQDAEVHPSKAYILDPKVLFCVNTACTQQDCSPKRGPTKSTPQQCWLFILKKLH